MSVAQNITTSRQRPWAGMVFQLCGSLLLVLALSACQTTKVEKWKPVRSQHKNQVHTVTWAGENLQVVAKWYTGLEKNWKEIANANPNILPSQLSPGDRILIPSALLKTRAPMSKIFLDEWLRSAKLRGKRTATPKNGEQAPLLVPKLHKLKQDASPAEQKTPLDIAEPEDDGDDLELFGPK